MQPLKDYVILLSKKRMSSIRNRTVKRSSGDAAVAGTPIDFAVNENLQRIIDSDASSLYRRPWHRLERGMRLNRLRLFANEMAETRSLKPSEKDALLGLLTRALDKKLLNSKTSVEYDPEEEKIKEIKPLVMHPSSTGEVLFQLLEKKNAVTFRKRAATAGAAAGGGSAAAAVGEPAAAEPAA
jgi:hypothetical protein